MRTLTALIFSIVLLTQTATAQSVSNDNRATGKQLTADLTAAITKVNDYWQSHHSPNVAPFGIMQPISPPTRRCMSARTRRNISTMPSHGLNTIIGREPHRPTRANGNTRHTEKA